MNVRLFSGRIATVILLCCILFIVCLPRDNIYDPANPEFVMPQFSGSVHLVDSATNNSITHATLYYSYDGLIDSAAVDTTGYALIQIRENSAGSRVEVRVNAIVSAMYVCSVPFSLSLYSEGRDTTIVMRDRSAGAVPWDSSLTHADVQGARLVWHSSDAEEFLYYLLVRIDPITGSGDTIEKAINRNDTSFTDSIVPENEVRMYRVDVVSTDGTVRSGPEYRVKLPNRNPAIANIISVDPDHFIFLRLSWQKNGNADFKQYVVYRSSDSISYTPVGTFASPEDTIWLDTTIDSTAQRYYYFIETVDTGALVSRSNVVSGINEAVAKDSLVYIRAGKFIMGRSGKDVPLNQQPAHTVYLSPYLIDRYEVTIAKYVAFLNDGNGSRYHDSMSTIGIHSSENGFSFEASRADHPIVWISWDDADEYCRWKSGSLPTEAQWEHAARGNDERIYPWGNSFYSGQNSPEYFLANYIVGYIAEDDSGYSIDGARYTAPVGNFLSGVSLWGIFDMAGNVNEWCRDWYINSFPPDTINPEGPGMGLWRSYRGGGFKGYPKELILTNRYRFDPATRKNDLGCRCVYDAE